MLMGMYQDKGYGQQLDSLEYCRILNRFQDLNDLWGDT